MRDHEKKDSVKFRGMVKNSSLTDWLIATFTLALVVVSFWQFKMMRRQLDAMDKQFQESHRPWVSITSLRANGPVTFDGGGAHVSITYSIRNGGTAPAFGTNFMNPELHVAQLPANADQARAENGCDAGSEGLSDFAGEMILPNEDHEDMTLEAKSKAKSFYPGTRWPIWMILSITYKDEVDQHHCTAASFAFFSYGNGAPPADSNSISGHFVQIGYGGTSY